MHFSILIAAKRTILTNLKGSLPRDLVRLDVASSTFLLTCHIETVIKLKLFSAESGSEEYLQQQNKPQPRRQVKIFTQFSHERVQLLVFFFGSVFCASLHVELFSLL